jgi:hypothetical protein
VESNGDSQSMGERHKGSFSPEEALTCHYCGVLLTRRTKTVEHLVPKSLGGRDEKFNKVFACIKCNQDKGDTWPNPSICNCSKCRKSIRIHREGYNVVKPKPPKAA